MTRVDVDAYLEVIHKTLSRSEVSAQLRNNFEHVIEQNKINDA